MDTEGARYDGWDAASLAARLGVPAASLHASVPSGMDVAHALAAAGASAGTIVLADEQTAGRGRAGRRWTSHPGQGLWLVLLERPNDAAALTVLSLRLGIAAAAVLDRFAGAPVQLKWPNDLYLDGRKLAGILVEARWREGRPDWVAVGFGLNVVRPADVPTAAGLLAGTSRVEVLEELLPALRAAAAARGALSPRELAAFAARDLAAGRACREPGEGVVRGITAGGELAVETAPGVIERFRAGSLVLGEDA